MSLLCAISEGKKCEPQGSEGWAELEQRECWSLVLALEHIDSPSNCLGESYLNPLAFCFHQHIHVV